MDAKFNKNCALYIIRNLYTDDESKSYRKGFLVPHISQTKLQDQNDRKVLF